jgi:hypothetical protein
MLLACRHGCLLDVTRLPTVGRALWSKADHARAYGHEKQVFEGFGLMRQGRSRTDTSGEFCQTDTPGLSGRVQMHDGALRSFRGGVRGGHRAYLVSFLHCSYNDSTFVFQALVKTMLASRSCSTNVLCSTPVA